MFFGKRKLLGLLKKKEQEIENLTKQVASLEESLETQKSIAKQLQEKISSIKSKNKRTSTIWLMVNVVLSVAAMSVLITTLWLPVLQVTGASMEPKYYENSVVLAAKGQSIGRGDIIAFYHNEKTLVKRVIGIPGDLITIDSSGIVSVNGKQIEEDYISRKYLGVCDVQFPVIVQQGTYFVMGDNRAVSLDSRTTEVGNISRERIIGKVVMTIWP